MTRKPGAADGRAFRAYALAMFTMVFSVNAPAPLFELFRRRMGLGPDDLALLYSIYALVVILTLPVFGRISDARGRRFSAAMGLGLLAAGCLALARADSLAGLLVGRLLQGLAVAAMSAPTAAALAELSPRGDKAVASLVTTLSLALGGALGPLFSGVLTELIRSPQPAAMLTCSSMAVAGAASILACAPPGAAQPTATSAPATGGGDTFRLPFWQAAVTVVVAFGVQSTFFTISGRRFAALFAGHPMLAAGVAMSILMLASAAGMFAGRRLSLRISVAAGLALLATGICAFFWLVRGGSFGAIVPSVLAVGAGHGLAYVGALRIVNETAPDDRRGAYTSMFYVAIYVGGGLPVLAMGTMERRWGADAASVIFGGVILLAASAVAMSLARHPPLGRAWPLQRASGLAP